MTLRNVLGRVQKPIFTAKKNKNGYMHTFTALTFLFIKSIIFKKDSDGLKTVQVQGITNKKTQFINLRSHLNINLGSI